MNVQELNQKRLAPLLPELIEKANQLIAQCAAQGVTILITQALRDEDYQNALYAQGRQSLGAVNALRLKVNEAPITAIENVHPVTNATWGHSFHCFGLAFDVVPETQIPPQPDWNLNHPDWKIILATGLTLGLQEGAQFRTFPDFPHFEITNGVSLGALRTAFADGGLKACYTLVENSK